MRPKKRQQLTSLQLSNPNNSGTLRPRIHSHSRSSRKSQASQKPRRVFPQPLIKNNSDSHLHRSLKVTTSCFSKREVSVNRQKLNRKYSQRIALDPINSKNNLLSSTQLNFTSLPSSETIDAPRDQELQMAKN